MAFVTNSTFKRIIRHIDLSSIEAKGEIYKWKLYMFNRYELGGLYAVKELLRNPEKFLAESYKPLENFTDDVLYVFETKQRARYHTTLACESLHSDYINYPIPKEILNSTSDLEEKQKNINAYRKCFKENIKLIETNPELLSHNLSKELGINVKYLATRRINTGAKSMINKTEIQLESEIDTLIYAANDLYEDSLKNAEMIKHFAWAACMNLDSIVLKNNTGISDAELRQFLVKYCEKFKRPLKELLIEYFRVKFNPELKFERNILHALKVEPCMKCK